MPRRRFHEVDAAVDAAVREEDEAELVVVAVARATTTARAGRARKGRSARTTICPRTNGSPSTSRCVLASDKLSRFVKCEFNQSQALEQSIVLATRYNIKPIRGRTILLVNASTDMLAPCSSAKGLGKPMTLLSVGLLLGLMCKFSCEDCEFILFDTYSNNFVITEPNNHSGEASILGSIGKLETLADSMRQGSVSKTDATAASAVASRARSLLQYFEVRDFFFPVMRGALTVSCRLS